MEIFIGCIIGVVTYSAILFIIGLTRNTWGTLHVDHSDPERDVYRINIDNLDCLNDRKRVILYVKHDNKPSQK